ncbi:hypothetical protein BN3590_03992 [Clostridium sp. C105KSO15]|nr:hypothetical protein BN3590_03992 [Clostridium sp. C105KSO15]
MKNIMNKKAVKIIIGLFAIYGILSFIVKMASPSYTTYSEQNTVKETTIVQETTIPETTQSASLAGEMPTTVSFEPETQPSTEAEVYDAEETEVAETATYDFGYNTNPDDVRYNPDYFTAGVEVIKNNGFIGGKVNITGLFTYAGTGNSVSMMQWYDSATMKNLDAYYISDPYGEGQYIVLSAYNSNVYADSYVTVYGTVIDIDKNGVVYIAGQLVEAAPAG